MIDAVLMFIFLCKVSILNINLFSKAKRTEKQLKECLFLRNAFFSWNFREKIYTFLLLLLFYGQFRKNPRNNFMIASFISEKPRPQGFFLP